MHPYSIDTRERRTVVFFLAIISLLLAYFLRELIKPHLFIQEIVFLVDLFSPFAIFTILYWLFDEWLWKVWFIAETGLINTPNLNGYWEGILQSSRDDFRTEHPIEIDITQTWTQISITLQTKSSKSYSETASLISKHPKQATLIYHYISDPNNNNPITMNTHMGTTSLEFNMKNKLVGKYYTGKNRDGNYGDMKLKKIG